MKKIALVLFLMTWGAAAHSAECGKVDNSSFTFNFQNGKIRSFAVDVRSGKLFVTKANSPKLFGDVEERFVGKSYDSRYDMGLFICLDKFSIKIRNYDNKERKYAYTEEHRLWEKGSIVAMYPQAANLGDLADQMGEFFDSEELADFNYTYKVIGNNDPNYLEVTKKANELVQQRDELLKPQGEVYEYTIYALFKAGELKGYVIVIDDYIDHSLWDGSGVSYYLDVQLNVNDEVEWTG